MRVRCADGPYAGTVFTLPRSVWKLIHIQAAQHVGPLVWIVYGPRRYCYQVVSNGWGRDFRLIYRDIF